MSCPRESTRAAFERLASDAVSRADPDGEEAAAASRVLLGILDEESYGAVRSTSLGGLTHVAAVIARMAAMGGSLCAVLVTEQAVPRLLRCLTARHSHEINSMLRSPQPLAPGSRSGSSAASATARAKKVLHLQSIGGFTSVVSVIQGVLACAGGVEEAIGADGAEAVTSRDFLVAAVLACPSETADLLAHLVWRGSRAGASKTGTTAIGKDEHGSAQKAYRSAAGDGSIGTAVGEAPAGGVSFAASGGSQQVGERALKVLLEIVLDAHRRLPTAGAATAATETSQTRVEFSSGIGVLSRLLHLRDGEVGTRIEAVLGKLAAAVRASKEGKPQAAGCVGGVYLTGKLIASLFVHVPEARPVLTRLRLLSE